MYTSYPRDDFCGGRIIRPLLPLTRRRYTWTTDVYEIGDGIRKDAAQFGAVRLLPMLHKSFHTIFDAAWVISQSYPSRLAHSLQVGMLGSPPEPWEDGPGRV